MGGCALICLGRASARSESQGMLHGRDAADWTSSASSATETGGQSRAAALRTGLRSGV